MPLDRLEPIVQERLETFKDTGTLKGDETVITGVAAPRDTKGARCFLSGQGNKEFLRMNSNSYLGLSLNREVIAAEEEATRTFGAGPGAVRFISGTYRPHVELEKLLAAFHGREAGMLFSAAYAGVMGVLPQLINEETVVISDELNHNCIINAVRLAQPAHKVIYRHLDMLDLETQLKAHEGKGKRAIVVTDGIFSMRGDCAPIDKLVAICRDYHERFEEGVITVMDDSHGVGAFGRTGRGTEEHTGAAADVLIATLGKALGVNGGYAVASDLLIRFLRETAPFYVYSNPISPSEAAAAKKALEIVDSEEGLRLLEHMRALTRRLEAGLLGMGFEVIESEHPIVPLVIRDTRKTVRMVEFLFNSGILATGIKYPVVPQGNEEIRFQVSADQTEGDIDFVLSVLKEFKKTSPH